jgi:predicted Zn-dependent protease
MVSRSLPLIGGVLLACAIASAPGCSGARGGSSPSGMEPTAVDALVLVAETAEAEGRIADAAASLERALRLAPDDADLWVRLARVRLMEGRPVQAESSALKATTLAGEDAALRRAAWAIVAEARATRGDTVGAEAAREQSER